MQSQVSRQPMPIQKYIKLLTVEKALLFGGLGVVLLPTFTNYNGPKSFRVVLRIPTGEEFTAQAQVDTYGNLFEPKPLPFACILPAFSKQSVPIGTEIWIAAEP